MLFSDSPIKSLIYIKFKHYTFSWILLLVAHVLHLALLDLGLFLTVRSLVFIWG